MASERRMAKAPGSDEPGQNSEQRPIWGEFLCAGTSAVMAICFTNPIDVIKTRMQLQGQLGQGRSPYSGVLDALRQIGQREGWRGLQRGLWPSCWWQFSNVSVRFGAYATAKRLTGVSADPSPLRKYLESMGLGAISGGFAALASNPFFIVKTRFQAMSTDTALVVGQQHALEGGLGGTLAGIVRADGPRGLFRGLSAFAPRVIVASAVQLSTYDTVKESLMGRLRLNDNVGLHAASSMVTGVAVVLAMQPFDFAATRLVNSLSAAEQGAAGAVFTGPVDVIRQTVATEGVLGVYKGVTANYLRFGPYCVLVFIFVEQLRRLERYALSSTPKP